MNKYLLLIIVTIFTNGAILSLTAQESYRLPPKRIVEIVDAPAPLQINISPKKDIALLLEYRNQLNISDLAQPMLKLAGIRILAAYNIQHRTYYIHKIDVLDLKTGKIFPVQLPDNARFGFPGWSHDGRSFAAAQYKEGGSQLWVFKVRAKNDEINSRITGKPIGPARLNTILLSPYTWERNSRHIIIPVFPEFRGDPPSRPAVPSGPLVQETSGVEAKLRTYQDLLQTKHDDELFRYYASAQLIRADIETEATEEICKPDLISDFSISPDGEKILLNILCEPFSHIVPYYYFAHKYVIWNKSGKLLKELAQLPASDKLPIEGVPTGMRRPSWQPLYPARLYWIEALDEGDPNNKVPFRDVMFSLQDISSASTTEIFRTPQRLSAINWLASQGKVLLSDYDRDRKWTKTWLVDTEKPIPASIAPLIFDLSIHDRYNDPGDPIYTRLPDGQSVVKTEGGSIFLQSQGATPQGFRPFLSRFDLETATSTRLFTSTADIFETFTGFADTGTEAIVTSRQSQTEPPNYYLRILANDTVGEPATLTNIPDPAPEFKSVKKELLSYSRKDGIPLSGMLYYPIDYKPGKRYPAVIWAYPREYASPDVAGQVRTTANSYSRIQSDSILFFIFRGYFVLNNAEIPVVGNPLTANDSFVEQITAGAEAAVNKLVEIGAADPKKIGIAGHSYGAFMVANLLAHTDLFAAGIARSGSYNRTLTPFGFQGERRTFWEAPEIYMKLSPFTHAHKIKKPLLLIHGEADPNPGTFPMQSERLFGAIRGAGGTAKLVLLPLEAHGYEARESILHVLAEMFDWFDRHLNDQNG